jgi:hypothetical protein
MLLGILLIVTACSGGDSADGAASTTEPAPTATPAETTAATEASDTSGGMTEAALARVQEYFAAVNEGRFDDLEAILGEPLTEGHRKNFMFHQNLNGDGLSWVLDSCEVPAATDEIVLVECRVTNTDPVFVAEGAADLIAPFSFQQGVLQELGWVPRGRSFQAPLSSYVAYLKAFHSDQYSVCDPLAQVGDFQTHFGVAKVPECGALLGPLRADIAAWVEAGKPTN